MLKALKQLGAWFGLFRDQWVFLLIQLATIPSGSVCFPDTVRQGLDFYKKMLSKSRCGTGYIISQKIGTMQYI